MELKRGAATDITITDTTSGRNGMPRANPVKQHVALFLPSLASGGAERVMLHIAEGLVDMGSTVDLVLSNASGAYLSQVPDGVRVVDLAARRTLLSFPGLVSYLRRERPNVLLSALAHTNLVALWASKIARANTRVVVAVHSTLSLSTKFSPRRRDRLVPWLSHMFYKQATHVVAVSTGSAQDLINLTGLDPSMVEVIPNPVITKRLAEKARLPVDLDWFESDHHPVLITVGRLTAAKNYPLLLQAFKILRNTVDARLLILGDGEERDQLDKLIAELELGEYVKMPGFVENPWAYMSRSDVFVLSSRWEGLPTVLVEALALGLRVVSTDCEYGPRELLKDGGLGLLVKVEDPDALAAGIRQALDSDPPNIDPKDLEEFQLETAVNRYKELLLNGSNNIPHDRA